MNTLLVHPISTKSDPAIQESGKMLTGKEPATPYVILGADHPLRAGCEDFILCPSHAKKSAEMSSLSALDCEGARLFHKALQNFSRYEPVLDQAGNPVDLLSAEPYGTDRVTKHSPLFNAFTGLLYTRVMAKIPRMEHLLTKIVRSGSKHKMDAVFDLKVMTAEGQGAYLIGPEFVALMDFIVCTCLWAQIPQLAPYRPFYERRVKLYAALDGKDGRLDMRAVLKAQLEAFFDRYPHHAKVVIRGMPKRSVCEAGSVQVSEVDIEEFATSAATAGQCRMNDGSVGVRVRGGALSAAEARAPTAGAGN